MSQQPVLLDVVRSGDVLAADLLDAAGHLLLPRGTVLCDASIAGLRRRGIESLVLADEAVVGATDAQVAAARRAVLEQALRNRFRRAGDGDATRLLFRATLEHLTERGA